VGFGSEILFVMLLGLVLLGPKRMHTMLGQVARAKAQFEKATLGLKSQLASELEVAPANRKFDGSHDSNEGLRASSQSRDQ
jgi:Sec-independent protein translocase protein TatA